jgi:sec-independent protein translocase protein TatA
MPTLVLLGMIAVLLFGKDLPQMGKKFGKIYVEMKRGYDSVQKEMRSVMKGIEDATNTAVEMPRGKPRVSAPAKKEADADFVEASAPRFEPPAEG